MTPTGIRVLTPAETTRIAPDLGGLLCDAVDDGASIGFLAALTQQLATDYWRLLATDPRGRVVLVAEDAQGLTGAVIVAPIDNEIQAHRAEVFKMVVHRRARSHGIGAALMRAAEAQAANMGKTLATLFTRNGCPAERLYVRLGWTKVGVIPDDSVKPDGTLCDAAVFYKRVAPCSPATE